MAEGKVIRESRPFVSPIPVSTVEPGTRTIRFCREFSHTTDSLNLEADQEDMVVRDFDVRDHRALDAEARAILGVDSWEELAPALERANLNHIGQAAQWFIDPTANKAALVVYREAAVELERQVVLTLSEEEFKTIARLVFTSLGGTHPTRDGIEKMTWAVSEELGFHPRDLPRDRTAGWGQF